MSTPYTRSIGSASGAHPAVLNRRVHDGLVAGLVWSMALVMALGIAVSIQKPNIALFLGGIALLLGVVWLMVNPRLEVTVTALAVFLGCVDGPIKLIANAGAVSSALQDVVMLAVTLGLFVRVLVRRRPARMPPLSGWVIAFVLWVLVEAFNPSTHGFLKILAGYRQELQWVPFFIFGYLLIRTPQRFRRLFIILGIITTMNGVVATMQTQMSPSQVASLGSGYNERVYGKSARKYVSEGEAHVRPLGLGSDSGFGGGLGVITLPGTLALLAVARSRRERWLALALCLGSAMAVATGLGRLQVGGAVLGVFAFAGLAMLAGRRISRSIAALLLVGAVALPLGAVFVSAVGEGIFSRYSSISPEKATSTATGYKQNDLKEIPHIVSANPFGYGLATAGAVSGFGGKATELLEGHNINAETQFNFLVKELGLPGLLIWTAFLIRLVVLAASRLRHVWDPDVQIFLVGVCAPLVAFVFMAFDGPLSASTAAGTYFWFAAGVLAYWLAGPGRAMARRTVGVPRSEVAV